MSTIEFYGTSIEPEDEGEPPSAGRLRSWSDYDCHAVDYEYEALIDKLKSLQDDEARSIDMEAEIYADALRLQALYDFDNPVVAERQTGRLSRIFKYLFKSATN
jgi:hypothetical protein